MNKKLIIHATNVHHGGGSSLLSALLEACPKDRQVVALLDSRMELPGSPPENLIIKYVAPTILQRLRSEWWLKKNSQSQDAVLCFGNLPPLFRLPGDVIVFVQNRYLVDKVTLRNFNIKIRLRISIERLWFSLKSNNVDKYIVQGPSMKKTLLSSSKDMKTPIQVSPFALVTGSYKRTVDTHDEVVVENKQFDFIYPASGEPHKNHRRLVNAWCLLSKQELFPSLCLTLDQSVSADLCAWIDIQKNKYKLNLENVGFVPHEKVLPLYAQSKALIYPSLFESFGLPLIEASQAGLPVLAAELDYVRDVLDPEESFDPNSSVSITRAVKRFIGKSEEPLPLLNAAQFIECVLVRGE